jgi:hypothetical protein
MKFLRIRQVMQLTGLSRMTIYSPRARRTVPEEAEVERELRGMAGSGHRRMGGLRPIVSLRAASGDTATPRA